MKFAFLALVLVALIMGCRPSSPLVDKWICPPITLEFRDDGTFIKQFPAGNLLVTYAGKYSLAGDKITMTNIRVSTTDRKSGNLVTHEQGPDDSATLKWQGKDEFVLTDSKGSATFKREG